MSYYDSIAIQWDHVTGQCGGPIKRILLNDRLIQLISNISNQAILELGAGNGYFLPLVLRRFSGSQPAKIMITDLSSKQLDIAQKKFNIEQAEYKTLNVVKAFPFTNGSFDLVIANMLFNELSNDDLYRCLSEVRRVLSPNGKLVGCVIHPEFITRCRLRTGPNGIVTMPGSNNLRYPIVVRSVKEYDKCFSQAGFDFSYEDISSTSSLLSEKPAFRTVGDTPLVRSFCCWKALSKGGSKGSEVK